MNSLARARTGLLAGAAALAVLSAGCTSGGGTGSTATGGSALGGPSAGGSSTGNSSTGGSAAPSTDTAQAPHRIVAANGVTTAASFVDSIGICTHLAYVTGPYGKFGQIQSALQQLGVRHIRDGVPANAPARYFNELRTLGQDGIRSDLVIGSLGRSNGQQLLSASGLLGAVASAKIAPFIDSIEGPNEWDMRGGSGWAGQVRNYQRNLQQQVNTVLPGVPLVGPSVAHRSDRGQLGNLSPFLTTGNNHTYLTEPPTEAAYADEITEAQIVSDAKPVIITETGYRTGQSHGDGAYWVTDQQQAAYVPRIFADTFLAGAARTYLYELVDEGAGAVHAHFGLLDSQLQPKPAFGALSRLIGLLTPGGAGAGSGSGSGSGSQASAASAPAPAYTISTEATDLRKLLLQRADGSFALLLWRDVEGTDVPPARVSVDLQKPATTTVYDPTAGAAPTQGAQQRQHTTVELSDHLVVLTLSP